MFKFPPYKACPYLLACRSNFGSAHQVLPNVPTSLIPTLTFSQRSRRALKPWERIICFLSISCCDHHFIIIDLLLFPVGQNLLWGLQRRLLEISIQWPSLISFSAPIGGVNFLLDGGPYSATSQVPQRVTLTGWVPVWSGSWEKKQIIHSKVVLEESVVKDYLLKSEHCKRKNKGERREWFKELGACWCCRNDYTVRLMAKHKETQPLAGLRPTGGRLGNKYPDISLLLPFHLLL